MTESYRIIRCTKDDLSVKDIDNLAVVMKMWQEYHHNLPGNSLEYFKSQLRNPLEIDRQQKFVLIYHENDLDLKGYGKMEWRSKGDNSNRCDFQIYLKDSFVELISRLLQVMVDELPPQINTIDIWVAEQTNFDQYLSTQGFSPSYFERISVAKFRDHFDRITVSRLVQERKLHAKERGFILCYYLKPKINEQGGTLYLGDLELESFCNAFEEIINDMPQEELTRESIRITPEKLISFYETNTSNGETFYLCVAIEEKTGVIAGITQTTLNEFNPKVSEQGDTGVRHKYRGNGLGLTMKYHTLKYLIEKTAVEYWMTGNAGSNKHMIAINDILKYEKWITANEYEIKVAQLKYKLHNE